MECLTKENSNKSKESSRRSRSQSRGPAKSSNPSCGGSPPWTITSDTLNNTTLPANFPNSLDLLRNQRNLREVIDRINRNDCANLTTSAKTIIKNWKEKYDDVVESYNQSNSTITGLQDHYYLCGSHAIREIITELKSKLVGRGKTFRSEIDFFSALNGNNSDDVCGSASASDASNGTPSESNETDSNETVYTCANTLDSSTNLPAVVASATGLQYSENDRRLTRIKNQIDRSTSDYNFERIRSVRGMHICWYKNSIRQRLRLPSLRTNRRCQSRGNTITCN